MKRLYMSGLLLFIAVLSQAQSYTFEELNGEYYDLQGAAVIEDTDYQNDAFHFIDIEGETINLYGLDFNFGGITTYVLQTLGNVRIDNDSPAIILDGLRSPHMDVINETSQLSVLVDGEPGSYVIKAEWKNHTLLVGEPGNFFNFQIWVYQETGVIEFRYGPRSDNNASGYTDENGPFIGIFYAPDNFLSVYEKLWISGEISDLQFDQNPTNNFDRMLGVPAEGTIYRFTPTFLSTNDNSDKEVITEFVLLPNPATNSVLIQGFSEPVLKVDIRNIQGKVIGQFSNANQIDISGFDSGVYIIRVETKSYIGVQRLVKY